MELNGCTDFRRKVPLGEKSSANLRVVRAVSAAFRADQADGAGG